MKQLLLLPFLSIGLLQANNQSTTVEQSSIATSHLLFADNQNKPANTQPEQGQEKMSAAVFKSQEYCRAELKDFEYDAKFTIVSATVYFSGANFRDAQKGAIVSSSLKPIRSLMDRCAPGSIVIFDDVKVIGPDNQLRTIPGISLMLR